MNKGRTNFGYVLREVANSILMFYYTNCISVYNMT